MVFVEQLEMVHGISQNTLFFLFFSAKNRSEAWCVLHFLLLRMLRGWDAFSTTTSFCCLFVPKYDCSLYEVPALIFIYSTFLLSVFDSNTFLYHQNINPLRHGDKE